MYAVQYIRFAFIVCNKCQNIIKLNEVLSLCPSEGFHLDEFIYIKQHYRRKGSRINIRHMTIVCKMICPIGDKHALSNKRVIQHNGKYMTVYDSESSGTATTSKIKVRTSKIKARSKQDIKARSK